MGFSRQEYWSGLPLPSPDRKIDLSISKFVSVHLQQLAQCSSPTYICLFESNQSFWLHFKFKSYFKKSWIQIFEIFSDYLFIYSSVYQRRQWHPTPVILPGKSHGWRSLVGCSPWGRKESDTTERLCFHFSLSCVGEGNGNPLQCSCLENPRDGGACWAAISGVAQSRTRLKWLSSSSSSSVYRASQVVLMVKNLCARAGDVRDLG